ncbi:hypothetical protein P6B95_25910 [Streptomyces atratus]|uniref:hypothetical protein n=1 Tax=Streptomyces atratus TaxID=1893 RepID=UPI002AC329E4|nr:hypothetical protein [Streptomyces atratus]WPW30466.1 hypothetical protein P6B95_25910 [Streptomyces atratus]
MARAGAPVPDLEHWITEGRQTVIDIADMLGVPPAVYTRDPLTLIPALQNYVSRLPFGQFEQSDWGTLHSDLMSYVSDFLIETHDARWVVVDDSAMPRDYRYVIEVEGRDGEIRKIDPSDIVIAEFSNTPIEITKMLSSAEVTLRLTPRTSEDE